MDQTNKSKKKSPWPYAIVAFFVVVISVNLNIARLASNSSDDLVESQPYEAGIAYEDSLQAQRRAKDLGVKARFETTALENGKKSIRLYLLATNAAVQAKHVQARFLKPENSTVDTTLIFEQDPEIPGSYRAAEAAVPSGMWLVELDFQTDSQLKIKEKVFID